MKQCPVCRTTYTDETLRFCLADGSALTGGTSDEPTIISHDPLRVEIPRVTQPDVKPPHVSGSQPSGGSGFFIKVLIGVLVLGFFVVILAAGVMGFLYFNRSSETQVGVKKEEARSSPTPQPTIDDTELKDQIANLEKILNEQLKNLPANIKLDPDVDTTVKQARVNSPSDGFLALRTFPSSETGERILQIPHGATFTVGGCLTGNKVRNKPGRWCRASYNGYDGWVYDAYLIY